MNSSLNLDEAPTASLQEHYERICDKGQHPMTWGEYKRLGPNSGSYSLREIGIGCIVGLSLGAGMGLTFPPAAIWLATGGAITGAILGTFPSIMRNQMVAYGRYLKEFEQVVDQDNERNRSLEQGLVTPSYIDRIKKEHQDKVRQLPGTFVRTP
jgi:hypothetical protein